MAKRARLSKADREAFWRHQFKDWRHGAGCGSCATEYCDAKKLISDGYSAFCLKT